MKNEIENYEKIYGRTSPVPFIFSNSSPNYNGCMIEGRNITFRFDKMSSDQMTDIETIFRNRLGRKFSFSAGESEMKVFVNPQDKEEAAEYLIAAMVVDRCFRGVPQDAERTAELLAYHAGEDWRDEQVVKRYL